MKLSVVTPTYNSEKFIADCVECVLSQKFTDFEHIIIDGESTDKTLEIVKSYPHLKLTSESDDGQSDALNKGFQKAKGEWILWLNSDDYILPGALNQFLKAIEKNPYANIVYGHMVYVDADKKPFQKIINVPYSTSLAIHGLNFPPSTGTFFKTSLLQENPLSQKHHYTMDTEWFLRTGSKIKPALINQFTVAFRFWGGNKTNNVLEQLELPEQHLKERKLNEDNFLFKKWAKDPIETRRSKYKFYQNCYKPLYYYQKLKAKLFSKDNVEMPLEK